MGATGWWYTVPYGDDLQHVLESLREQVFMDREYQYLPYDNEGSWPATMAELFADEYVQESGTHSILDVWQIINPSDEDGFGTLRPVRPDELTSRYGTARPTWEIFEKALERDSHSDESLTSSVPRGSGRCTVLYDTEGRPAEIAIWGKSGD